MRYMVTGQRSSTIHESLSVQQKTVTFFLTTNLETKKRKELWRRIYEIYKPK
jgi:hypothetical protein